MNNNKSENKQESNSNILIKIAIVIFAVAVCWNVYRGLTIRKVGIPGIIEVEFGDDKTPTSNPTHIPTSIPTLTPSPIITPTPKPLRSPIEIPSQRISVPTSRPQGLNIGEFINAAQKGDLEKVKNFVTEGIDINGKDREGRTALMWASLECRIDVVDYLLKGGANISIRDQHNRTAREYAPCPEVLQKIDSNEQ